MADRKLLMIYDLTECLNVAVMVIGCPTQQVCVAKCPDETFSPREQLQLDDPDEDRIKKKMID